MFLVEKSILNYFALIQLNYNSCFKKYSKYTGKRHCQYVTYTKFSQVYPVFETFANSRNNKPEKLFKTTLKQLSHNFLHLKL